VNGGSDCECPTQNGMLSGTVVDGCASDLSTAAPDVARDGGRDATEMTQHGGGVVVDRRLVDHFAHLPRKRFRYELPPSYVATSGHDAAPAADVDVGRNGSGNDVINLTTSTRAGSPREKTRETAVQCALTTDDDEGGGVVGFSDPRGAVYRQQSAASIYDCSTSAAAAAAVVGSFCCWYCGIAFDDDVLHAIHMGCHSVADKFVCNVCGLACADRFGFNSHLVRGHVQATAVSEPAGSVLALQLPANARLVPQTASLPLSSTSSDTRCCSAYDRR